MQADSIQPGQTVVVIDDLIATGVFYLDSKKAEDDTASDRWNS